MSATPVRIFVPVDAAALSVGAEAVAQAIASEAAARGLSVEIVRNGSRGMLWLEPMVEVETNEGRIAYGPVAAKDVSSLFDAGLVTGGAHGLRLGKTEELDWMKRQQRLTFERVGVIDPLSIADYRAHGGFKGLEAALGLTGGEIVEAVKASGLRGRGGAGFPTGIKWKTVHDARAEQKYIVCNADEGDSGTFADRMLFEGDPYLVIEGMAIAAIAVGATQGLHLPALGISARPSHASARDPEGCAPPDCSAPRCSARSTLFDLEVRARRRRLYLRRGDLPAGEPGRQARHRPGQAAAAGACKGSSASRPSSTTCSPSPPCPWIMDHGAQAYADYGMGRSRGTLPIQLGGNVRRGGLIELAFGISLREIIEDMGGGTLSGRPIRAVQVGGPLGAYLTRRAARRADGLRGARRDARHARPWRHRRLRRQRRHGQAGPLRLRILRQGKLRQVHALPHRRDARRRNYGSASSPAPKFPRTSPCCAISRS